MKKIIASAVGIMMVGGVAVTNASAVENIFGGYWRTRVSAKSDFKQTDDSFQSANTRTRLYYTAKFSDNFKFVNKFEHDTVWGDDVAGDIGSDGKGMFEIKNVYADFTLGAINTKMGIHGGSIARGFLFDADHSGITVTGDFGNVSVPLMWIRVHDEYKADVGYNEDIFAVKPKIKLGDSGSITPFLAYHGADGAGSDIDQIYLGTDVDLTFGDVKTWGTFIYQSGTNEAGEDNAGYLAAAGGSVSVINGEIFYATGDDSPMDGDNDAFVGLPGQSYWAWSEIMGYGTLDSGGVSNGSPGDLISNIFAVKVGVKVKPVDKWTLSADLWYAQLAEEDVNGNDELGTEIDLKATYKVMDNLNLDLVGAYLFAGDATGEEDPTEIGARLSLSF